VTDSEISDEILGRIKCATGFSYFAVCQRDNEVYINELNGAPILMLALEPDSPAGGFHYKVWTAPGVRRR
jgi:hypothetical protein